MLVIRLHDGVKSEVAHHGNRLKPSALLKQRGRLTEIRHRVRRVPSLGTSYSLSKGEMLGPEIVRGYHAGLRRWSSRRPYASMAKSSIEN